MLAFSAYRKSVVWCLACLAALAVILLSSVPASAEKGTLPEGDPLTTTASTPGVALDAAQEAEIIKRANELQAVCDKNLGSAKEFPGIRTLKKTCTETIEQKLRLEAKQAAQKNAALQSVQDAIAAAKKTIQGAAANQATAEVNSGTISDSASNAKFDYVKVSVNAANKIRSLASNLKKENDTLKKIIETNAQFAVDEKTEREIHDTAVAREYSSSVDEVVDRMKTRASAIEAEAAQDLHTASRLNSNASDAFQAAGLLGGSGNNGSNSTVSTSDNHSVDPGAVPTIEAALTPTKKIDAGGMSTSGDNTLANNPKENSTYDSSATGLSAAANSKAGDQQSAKSMVQKALEDRLAQKKSRGLASIGYSATTPSANSAVATTAQNADADAEKSASESPATAAMNASGGGQNTDLGLAASLGADKMNFSELMNQMLGLGDEPPKADDANNQPASRELAALTGSGGPSGQLPDGILSRDSGTLFDRVKQANLRFRKSGKVLDGLNSKI